MKTALVTLICGVGHIASSVVLGLVGVSVGLAVTKLEFVESRRGNLAAWFLIAFGLIYFVWGLRRAYRSRSHVHAHTHGSEGRHVHTHSHHREHTHVHNGTSSASITPWALFVVFVFGPCEPLIPVLMYPAFRKSLFGLVAVTCVFGTVTIGTMLGLVLLSRARGQLSAYGEDSALQPRDSWGDYMPLRPGHPVSGALSPKPAHRRLVLLLTCLPGYNDTGF